MQAIDITVGHVEIDAIHEELAAIACQLGDVPDSQFKDLFLTLIEHTEAHFSHEEELMRMNGFIHAAEHIAEHKQMLGEMRQFANRRLPIARAYVRQRLAERFNLHITRMDSLLAAYLGSH